MTRTKSFIYPHISSEFRELLQQDDKKVVVIGVLGKSTQPDCNKMAGFDILQFYTSLNLQNRQPKDGQITFYFNENENILYVHFETTFDSYVMQQMANDLIQKEPNDFNLIRFNGMVRARFAQMLLFAIHICHIIVLVETANVFDSSYLSIFKALRTIREKYVLKFLPKLLNNSSAGQFMGKEARLCSPRFIFFFEKYLLEYEDTDSLQKLEFDIEDRIYKMLRNEFIITNDSSISLFSIPRNKRFVYINRNSDIRSDPLIDSINFLNESIERTSHRDKLDDDLDDFRPFVGFAKSLNNYQNEIVDQKKTAKRTLLDLLKEHVGEALKHGFDDSVAKFKGKSHFVIPNLESWFETFKIIHNIFIENPDNPDYEANSVNYKAYLDNFHKVIDIDERFFSECCEYGLELAIDHYKDMLPYNYSSEFHEQKIFQSFEILSKYARTEEIATFEMKLRKICDEIWQSGKQQCEILSLRNNPCVMPKHDVGSTDEHSSGISYVSTCNCGRTQGHRDDPYTIRQANYDFYNLLANSCHTCNKLEKINFAVFEPSINDFKAAAVHNIAESRNKEGLLTATDHSPTSLLVATQNSLQTSLSLGGLIDDDNADTDLNEQHQERQLLEHGAADADDKIQNDYDLGEEDDEEDDDSVNEIVINVGSAGDPQLKLDKNMIRQPSTTEYLDGMVHTNSPMGLLPQFPSWSLVCIGPSSVYSHNTGLPEHVQRGFLSGANYLLPWDVHVRLKYAASWAASYEKSRHNHKKSQAQISDADGHVFVLKIFIGCEYECPRGHRFIMNTPDKVLRGGSGIVRDSGSKVVFNDMPLYFPCPCRSANQKIAQLMRVHIVTPKAPVNVILEPKIRTGGKKNYVFVTGLSEPPKLSQSAYWILRLPYIYQGDDGPILPPTQLNSSNAMMYGCLLAGMYGISETESNNI